MSMVSPKLLAWPAAVLIGIAGSLIGAAGPVLAEQAVISVNPSSGLLDGQVVTVSGSGFAGGQTIYVAECQANASAPSCDLATVKVATVDANGVLSATFTVDSSFSGADPDTGNPTGNVDCRVEPGCVIAASADRSSSLVAPPVSISFS